MESTLDRLNADFQCLSPEELIDREEFNLSWIWKEYLFVNDHLTNEDWERVKNHPHWINYKAKALPYIRPYLHSWYMGKGVAPTVTFPPLQEQIQTPTKYLNEQEMVECEKFCLRGAREKYFSLYPNSADQDVDSSKLMFEQVYEDMRPYLSALYAYNIGRGPHPLAALFPIEEQIEEPTEEFVEEPKVKTGRRNFGLKLLAAAVVGTGVAIGFDVPNKIKFWWNMRTLKGLKEKFADLDIADVVKNPDKYKEIVDDAVVDADDAIKALDNMKRKGTELDREDQEKILKGIGDALELLNSDLVQAAHGVANVGAEGGDVTSFVSGVMKWKEDMDLDGMIDLSKSLQKLTSKFQTLKRKVGNLNGIDHNPEYKYKVPLKKRAKVLHNTYAYFSGAANFSDMEESEDVLGVQAMLNDFGFLRKKRVDGVWRDSSKKALEKAREVFESANELKKRDVGAKVKALQRLLVDLGYFPVGKVDGDYGDITEEACKNFLKESL